MNLPVFREGNTMDSETRQSMTGHCLKGEKEGIWADTAVFFSAFVYVWKPSIIKFPKIKLTLTSPCTKCRPQRLLEGPGSAVLHALPQHPPPDNWLECTVSLHGACLPSWQQGECHDAAAAGMLRAGKGEIIRQSKSKSQRECESTFKDPTPVTLITKSLAWQPVGAEVGAECWDRCLAPLQKAALSLRHKVFQFFYLHNKMGL